MDVVSLLRAAKEAAGGAVWDRVRSLHLRFAIHQGGLSGTLEQWQDVQSGRYAERHRLGVTAGGEGFDGTVPWSLDSAGYTRREEHGDAQEAAANSVYRTRRDWWHPERGSASLIYAGDADDGGHPCHVLRITPDNGRPFDIWLDAATALMTRTVERGAFETVTHFFSDYRTIGGLRLPFRIRVSNGHARYDQERDLQKVVFNPPDLEARLGLPPPPAPDFQIAADRPSVEFPFRLIGGLIVLDASVDGKRPLPFILDTGGVNLVTPEAAEVLGLSPQGAFWGFGGGEGTVDVQVAAVSSLEFGGVRLTDQVVWVYPFPGLKEALGLAELGGLLGYEVFRRLVVQVDNRRQKLTLTRPEHFTPSGNGIIVPFRFHSNIPEVEGALDGIAGRFDLDTGNTGVLLLNAPFVEKHGLATRYGATEVRTGEGAGGGPVSFLAARAGRLQLGALTVEDLPVALSVSQSGALSNPYAAGIVGSELFMRYRMTFDYTRQ